MTPKYAQVLVDINKLGTKTFSYLIPEALVDEIKIGQAVAIPFGNRKEPLKAYVVGFTNYLEAGIKAKEISEILDSSPLFSLEYLQLLEWVSSYYFCDIQTVLNTALPQKFFEKNVKKYRTPKIKSKLFDVEKVFHYRSKQTRIFEEREVSCSVGNHKTCIGYLFLHCLCIGEGGCRI